MREYYQFGKKHFEYELRGILIKNRLGFLKDITQEYIENGGETWEKIYSISTSNKSVDIMVFSSVDMRTNHVRENGNDAVRLVLRWRTKNGFMYQRIAKHYRLRTLFDNLKKSIENSQKTVFNLKYSEFSKEVN